MGITNTISELSNYFYQWHKNKYDEIHKDNETIIQTIYKAIFSQGGIQETLNTLTLDFNNLLNRYNTLTANSNSTIRNLETDISANKTNITDLSNNKANKSDVSRKGWTHSEQIGDWRIDDEYHPSTVSFNEDTHIGRLYVYAPIKGRGPYKVNKKTGYTDFLQADVSIPKVKPYSNVCAFSNTGRNKIKFQNDGTIWGAFPQEVSKDSYPVVRGTLVFFSGYHD